MKFNSEMSESVFRSKYMLDTEKEPIEAVNRIVGVVKRYFPDIVDEVKQAIVNKWLGIAGGLYRAAENPNKNVSVINCTTLGNIDDTLESISNGWYRWAKYAAYGQGEGIDLSNLRPNGAKVHNSSRNSTGPVSFMYTYDAILSIIAQQGRRGASLVSLNIKHPDILDFIQIKAKSKGLKNPFGDEIFSTMNISVMITDDFMKAVEQDKVWEFQYKNKYETITSSMSAKDLFNIIATSAWESGDPGILFWDNASKYSNSNYLDFPIECTNACGEVPQDPDNVCMLSSINLAKFNEYGIEGYRRLIKLLIYVLDAFRRYELDEDRSPTAEQKWKLEHLPRVGAGSTGWADYFIRKGIRYGSEESIKEVEELSYIMAEESYIASYEIAKNVDGKSFSTYDKEKYMKSAFVKNLLKKGFDSKYLDYQAHVTKNAIAPTGTLSMIVEAGGSGIEPLFAKYYVRRERSTSDTWKEWFSFNDLVVQELTTKGLDVTKENADNLDPSIWVTAHDVDNLTKINLVSVAQKYTDSAISVTYNLNKNAPIEEVRNIYWAAWKNKLKGVTVYREGSKEGVLITDANYEESKSLEQITNKNRYSPSRPETVACDIHQIKANGIPHIVLVGLVENEPYEIFATSNEDNVIKLGKYKKGFIKKQKKGHYTLIVENGEEKTVIDNLNETFNVNYNSLSRFISMSLRHKVPTEFIVDQLAKDKNFVGFEKSVSRILKKYIKENEVVKTSETCPSCNSKQLVYKEGCKSCVECGWSKCD